LHAIENLDNTYRLIVLLQPTSPLRTSRHIDDAFSQLNKHDTTSLISVYIPEKSPFKCFVRDQSGYLTGLVSNEAPFMNRQELPEVFMPNGAIYIFSIEEFLEGECIPVNRVIPFIMNERESIDIDTQEDVDLVEKIMQKDIGTYANE
jgi:CMP-N-acetylneuraminic acid synthetase